MVWRGGNWYGEGVRGGMERRGLGGGGIERRGKGWYGEKGVRGGMERGV